MTNPQNASVGVLERKLQRNKDFVSRQIAGEFLLVPVTNRLVEASSLFVLNEVGARVWELVETALSGSEIKSALLEEYDTSEEQVERDLIGLLEQLEQIGAIEPAGA